MKVGQILDGEIYIHGKSFQQIVRLVKKLRPESKTLQYHIYDIADQTKEYSNRKVLAIPRKTSASATTPYSRLAVITPIKMCVLYPAINWVL